MLEGSTLSSVNALRETSTCVAQLSCGIQKQSILSMCFRPLDDILEVAVN